MAVWEKKNLFELGELQRGRSRHRPRNDESLYGGEYPFVQTGDVKSANFYVTKHEQTYNEKGLAQSKLWSAGTLCITIAANIAESAVLKYPACFPDSVLGFTADNAKSDVKFVKYALDHAKTLFQNNSKGATQDNLSLGKIEHLKFPVPSVEVQREVGALVNHYDELIENNSDKIFVLEEMAQRLYTEWFVNFKFPGHEGVKMVDSGTVSYQVPEGWSMGKLSDIVENTRNSIQKGAALGDRKYVPIDSIDSKQLTLSSYKSNELAQSSLVAFEKGDVLFGAMRPYFHKVSIAPFAGVTRTTCFVLRPKISPSFAAITLFQKEVVDFATAHSQGATIPYATWDNSLEKKSTIIPDKITLDKYDKVVNPMLELAQNLVEQNQTLQQMRDLLIPQLVTGKRELK